jgi:hypothetical protein
LSIAGKWMELENIILSEVRFWRPKATYSLSYVEHRPNTKTVILWKTGCANGRSHTREEDKKWI